MTAVAVDRGLVATVVYPASFGVPLKIHDSQSEPGPAILQG